MSIPAEFRSKAVRPGELEADLVVEARYVGIILQLFKQDFLLERPSQSIGHAAHLAATDLDVDDSLSRLDVPQKMKLNVTVGAFGVPVVVQLENLHKILDCFIRNPSIISVGYFGVPYRWIKYSLLHRGAEIEL
ncbi:hypothetical protein [Mesorhizobium sp.]|uniref:hypothetical protein n=1 Tax=Mesorhizobium sp. TaxID=1871066 RepID=UPI0012174B53|nr:hypothetical protein [Mesorhizobium sp.]TIL32934.1 MAG: hypothetical protein E5Y82_27755 [Mesorhizobium sp.]